MNLLLLDRCEIDATGIARIEGTRARHLRSVLKVQMGQEVRVGVVDGAAGTGHVTATGDDHVMLSCTLDARPMPRPRVDVLLALPRPKVMRRLWAQLAALGVGQIVLTNAERVERNYFDTHVLDPGCYRPLLIEGMQQARDTRVPLVSVHRRLKVLLEDDLDGLFRGGVRLLAHPRQDGERAPDGQRSLGVALAGITERQAGERALLAIGPEGGWTAFEQQLLAAHGFQPVDMGRRTLRSDTACIALLAILHDALAHAVRHDTAAGLALP
jgi:RsmE family RNA methyltransferase